MNTISETFNTTSTIASNTHTVDYENGGTHYLSGHTTDSKLALYVNNFPSLTDLSNTYTLSAVTKGASSANSYVNSIQLEDKDGNTSQVITPKFPSAAADLESLVSERTADDFILQQFTYMYLDGSGHVLSNLSTFQ